MVATRCEFAGSLLVSPLKDRPALRALRRSSAGLGLPGFSFELGEAGPHLGEAGGVGRGRDDVVRFARVGGEVKELLMIEVGPEKILQVLAHQGL